MPSFQKRTRACNLSERSSVGRGEATSADPYLACIAGPNRIDRIDSLAVLQQHILDVAPRVRAFARRLCRDSHDAEEVAQDALARALRYRDALDPDLGSLQHWMMKTAFRSYLDHRARAAPRVEMGEMLAPRPHTEPLTGEQPHAQK